MIHLYLYVACIDIICIVIDSIPFWLERLEYFVLACKPIPPRVKFRPISGCSNHSGQFRPKYKFEPVPNFGFFLKKINKINPTFFFFLVTDPSFFFFFFSFFLGLGFRPFFFFFFSSSSGGFWTLLLLFFFFSSGGFWSYCQFAFPFLFVCCTGNVFDYLLASLHLLKCYILCFKIFICSVFASPHTLLFCHLCFKI